MKKILIMGLPGSGKTTLALELVSLLNAKWINNDEVRKAVNDWDFSGEGRVRQAKRMADLAEKYKQEGNFVVCDFICPTLETRKLFDADIIIWMDTVDKCQFEDTNELFVPPSHYEENVKLIIRSHSKNWAEHIVEEII
tara:strand:- start:48 stop:464 length:417 start_codon:yes stop_codon:yes gene_type:complete